MDTRALVGTIAFAALVAPAAAQKPPAPPPAPPPTGFYLGAGGGAGVFPFDDDFVQVTGATASEVTTDEGAAAYKAFLGYRFHPNVAIEGGYFDFGKFKFKRNVTSPFGGTAEATVKSSGWGIDAVAIFPLARQWSLFGKVGGFRSTTKTTYTSTGAVVFAAGTNLNPERKEWNLKLGFGGQFDFHRNFAVRAEIETVVGAGDDQTGEGNVSMLSIGLLARF